MHIDNRRALRNVPPVVGRGRFTFAYADHEMRDSTVEQTVPAHGVVALRLIGTLDSSTNPFKH